MFETLSRLRNNVPVTLVHRRPATQVESTQPPASRSSKSVAIEILPESAFVVKAAKCGVPALFGSGEVGTEKSTLVRMKSLSARGG